MEGNGGAVLRWPDDTAEDRGLNCVACRVERQQVGFSPSQSCFMINYRVDNLGELLEQLRAGGVAIIQGPESHETASLRGLWTQTATRSSSGNRKCGTTRTKVPDSAA